MYKTQINLINILWPNCKVVTCVFWVVLLVCFFEWFRWAKIKYEVWHQSLDNVGPSSGVVLKGSGLMRSETNGLRAQTTTSPLAVRYATRKSSPEIHSEHKSLLFAPRCCLLATELAQKPIIHYLEPWPRGAGAHYWQRFLCGCVWVLVSCGIKEGRILKFTCCCWPWEGLMCNDR